LPKNCRGVNPKCATERQKWGDREQAILFVTGVTFITNKSYTWFAFYGTYYGLKLSNCTKIKRDLKKNISVAIKKIKQKFQL